MSSHSLSLQAIAAVADNGVIGCQGSLPWHLPAELKLFKQLTLGGVLLMGRKTYASIGRPLPGRTTVVLSSGPRPADLSSSVLWLKDWTTIWGLQALEGQQTWVCGGAAIYKLLLPYCHTFWVTHVHQKPQGDTYLPEWQPSFVAQEVVHAQAEFTLVRYTQANPEVFSGPSALCPFL